MGDPVSWLMIRPGWKVYASDGTEVGQVDEVTGDENVDIFDGLAVAASALAKPKYVPAESVATITEGRVDLSLSSADFAETSEFLEPATSAEIEPGDHRGLGETIGADARELEGKAIHPVEQEKPVGLIRRIDLWFRRTFGR
ncbi:MAG TPA: DUF2171 domain-containing protein [Gaiellaceae bacterium]|jgi:hypothetical protein